MQCRIQVSSSDNAAPSHERLVNVMRAHTNAEQARNVIHKGGEAV